MTSDRLISIIIPCYRGERYLPLAIESCLKQDYGSFEVIIVDDGSPDNCGEIAAEFAAKDSRCKVVTHSRNKGVAEAFNSGFNAARGVYLTRLAQDDIFKEQALSELTTFLDTHPGVDMVYSDMELIDAEGDLNGLFSSRPADEALGKCNGIGVCWLFRRKIWDAGVRFDKTYDQIEDFEFWMRASRNYCVDRYTGAPLLQFRKHSEAGTAMHSAKMEVLTGRVIASYANSSRVARTALAEGYFNASYISRQQKKQKVALQYALLAIVNQPAKWRNYRNLFGTFIKR